jgi:hypothetical protein
MILTPPHSVAPQSAARLSAADLAQAGGFGIMTVKRLRAKAVTQRPLDRMCRPLKRAGVTFIGKGEALSRGEGVRLTSRFPRRAPSDADDL